MNQNSKHKKPNTNKGITLIALVITIIVMLILVAVTISMAVNGGLFKKTGDAVGQMQNAIDKEQQLANGKIKIGDKWYASIDDYLNNNPITIGIEVTPAEITLKKNEEGAAGKEVLTGTITASIFGMENEPEIIWVESSDAIELSATKGKSITVTAVGTENAEATVTAKCTYEGKEYPTECKVTLEIIEKEETYTAISTTESYVGRYADLDSNPETIEGIIYADLAVGVSGTYFGTTYLKEADTNGLKEYYVSKTAHKGTFGNDGKEIRDVITVMPNTTGVKDRFYVMALTDIDGQQNGTKYTWYAASSNNPNTSVVTEEDFGKGKTNTAIMIGKWDSKEFGAQDNNASYKDVWGQIKKQVNAGWFVPSKEEWAAFAEAFELSSDHYSSTYYGSYGLSNTYWSSSQRYASTTWYVYMPGCGFKSNIDENSYVRLGTTF